MHIEIESQHANLGNKRAVEAYTEKMRPAY